MAPNLNRRCGILLHPSSLADMEEAYPFMDFLDSSGQSYWQMLPINPVMREGSPYKCYSAFAADTRYISKHKVQYDYKTFIEENTHWLNDYALFRSLKKYFDDKVWNKWDRDIAFREPKAISYYTAVLKEEIEKECLAQYEFFCSWKALSEYAEGKRIRLIGDMPLYVAHDSADTWALPHLFKLDKEGSPAVVAGVPPDYFSKDGQLWGNPVYDWEAMEADKFSWWVNRLGHLKKLFHFIRIDHFRGLESFWEVDSKEKTAVKGTWVKAPGENLLGTVTKKHKDISLIAEDLGIITREVTALRDEFHLPGIQVLQFDYIPRRQNTVFYSGTHDNDTLLGWFRKIRGENPGFIENMLRIMNIDSYMQESEIMWGIIEYMYKGQADAVILPMQDILGLGSEARMNVPGIAEGNWNWKMEKGALKQDLARKLKGLSVTFGR